MLLSTTGNAEEDFNEVLRPMLPGEVPEDGSGGWVLMSFDLSKYKGKEGYIAIHHKDYDKCYLIIDDFFIEDPDEEWKTIETTKKHVTLEGLKANSYYMFDVTAFKAGEEDVTSEYISFKTLGNHPQPSDVVIKPATTSARVYWKGYSDSYVVSCYNKITSDLVGNYTSETTECTLDGLQPNTAYRIYIYGLDSNHSVMVQSDSYLFITRETAPIDIVIEEDGYNESELYSHNGAYANVTIEGRTFRKDGTWQTICLPFRVDVEHSVLKGAEVRTIKDVTVRRQVATLNCTEPVDIIEAGMPYVIKWESGLDIDDPVFEGVKIDKEVRELDGLEEYGLRFTTDLYSAYEYYFDSYTRGCFRLTSSPILKQIDDEVLIGATECQFFIDDELLEKADYFILNTGDQDDLITGIDITGAEQRTTEIYNLSGQRLNRMQKGINIVNGKKILIK